MSEAPARLLRLAALVFVCALMYGIGADVARSAVPTWTHDCAADIDPGFCERVEFIATTLDAQRAENVQAENALHGDVWVVVGAIAAAAVAGAFLQSVLWRG
jgi:hypothetical protein